MHTNRPKQRTSASFEYFLYAAIIVETALAAFVYKTIFRDPDLGRLSLYFGIFYFVFLAWSIIQLNKVHRRRKLVEAEPMSDQGPTEDVQRDREQNRAAAPERTRSVLGLTTAQLVIVVAVFVAAVVTFSWALKMLR
jgi:hypothetical protein